MVNYVLYEKAKLPLIRFENKTMLSIIVFGSKQRLEDAATDNLSVGITSTFAADIHCGL